MNADGDPLPDNAGAWRAPLALAALALALWALARYAPGIDALERFGDEWIARDARLGVPLFLLIGVAMTAVGLPRQSVAVVGGYLFGAWTGGLLALLAMLGGCVLAYEGAALVGAERIAARYPASAARLASWTRTHAFRKTLMLRLLPLGSNVATNLAAGIARTPRLPFFGASLIGFAPQALVFTLVGSGIDGADPGPILTGAALLAASMLIGLSLARR